MHVVISIGKRSLCILSTLLFLSHCGAQRALSGIWQQSPYDGARASSDMSVPLYELDLGQYGQRISGLLVRYQVPNDQSLSTFDTRDQCDCTFISQGTINPQIAFSLFNPETPYVLSVPPACTLNQNECERVFNLTEEEDDLVGETWCIDQKERTQRSIRFVRVPGIPINQCVPLPSTEMNLKSLDARSIKSESLKTEWNLSED